MMTNDDIRRIASEIKRELRQDVRLMLDGLMRVEHELVELKGDVLHLKNDKIAREAREDERSRAAKQAAEIVANKAADAIAERDWSFKKKATIASLVTGGLVAITGLTGLLSQYVYHSH